ncbi:hyaluronidase PH-20-like [Erinaceus europaeus]|uniref:Hyaluronidase n=1 Tax=Erinaceus europaeus TaxID=9365 RepID=A0A1S3AA25_ERIEU|nr:hyaluronidase PH-20-like [Erinaceus europaeus]
MLIVLTMEMLSLTQTFFRSFVGFNGPFQAAFTFLLFTICSTQNFRAPPLIPNVPYLWAWNAPTERCNKRHGVSLDLRLFSLVGSSQKDVTRQNITLFYPDQLGYYPYINRETKKRVNGGIPRLRSLKRHLRAAKEDITHYIPTDNVGLAVIDWEEWQPLWERNWEPNDVYRQLSMKLVRQRSILLNKTETIKVAKREFEKAAKNFMQETLSLGKLLRPNFLWGYYLFPDCYNYYNNAPNYTGGCSGVEKRRNDELDWMWNESTALYPSIYLKAQLSSTPQAALFVRNRIQEAIRVSKAPHTKRPIPVFVYTRPDFQDLSTKYLPQVDLESTIGESVALGASGIVIWRNFNLTQSRQSCMNLSNYVKTKLNPYLINVTLAGKMCSQMLCQDQGVCIRRYWNSSDYLHLNPRNFAIQTGNNGKYSIHGKPTLEDLHYFSDKFYCSCYANIPCRATFEIQKNKTIHVCVAEDICIDVFLNRKRKGHSSRPSRVKAKSKLSRKVLSHTAASKMSPCVSGKVPRKCDTIR